MGQKLFLICMAILASMYSKGSNAAHHEPVALNPAAVNQFFGGIGGGAPPISARPLPAQQPQPSPPSFSPNFQPPLSPNFQFNPIPQQPPPQPTQNFSPPLQNSPPPPPPPPQSKQPPQSFPASQPPPNPQQQPPQNIQQPSPASNFQPQQPQRCQLPDNAFPAGGKLYYFSWMTADTQNAQKSWSEARQICKQLCMDLSTLETAEEDNFVLDQVDKGNVYGAWVGGQLCSGADCPLTASGTPSWVWEPKKRLFLPERYQNWSDNGARGLSQPDNYTGREGCLAILTTWYEDGMKWHDMECEDKLPFICEN